MPPGQTDLNLAIARDMPQSVAPVLIDTESAASVRSGRLDCARLSTQLAKG